MRQSGEKENLIMELKRSLHVPIAPSGIASLVAQTKMKLLKVSLSIWLYFALCFSFMKFNIVPNPQNNW